ERHCSRAVELPQRAVGVVALIGRAGGGEPTFEIACHEAESNPFVTVPAQSRLVADASFARWTKRGQSCTGARGSRRSRGEGPARSSGWRRRVGEVAGAGAPADGAGPEGADSLAGGPGAKAEDASSPRLRAGRTGMLWPDMIETHQRTQELALGAPELPDPRPRPQRIVNIDE